MNEKLYEQEFMSANRAEIEAEEAILMAEAHEAEYERRTSRPEPNAITAADILARIDTIIACDNSDELVQRIVDIPVNDSPHGGLDGQARAEAIQAIAMSRATTNQRALELLQQMYDDLVKHKAADPAAWKQQFEMQTRAGVIEMLEKAMQKALDEGDMDRFENLHISINSALRDM